MTYKTHLQIAATSVIGNHRSHNEDNYYINGRYLQNDCVEYPAVSEVYKSKQHIVSVFDGMGGEKRGDAASLFAAKSCHVLYKKIKEEKRTHEDLYGLIDAYTNSLNHRMCLEAERLGVGRIGTTMATLLIVDGVAHIFNLGDSRVYLYRRKMLNRITNDHNEAAMLIKLGMLTPEDARNHPSKYRLTQHLGIKNEDIDLQPEKYPSIQLLPGDIFLLCSDGLMDDVTDLEITNYLSRSEDIADVANEMIQDALKREAKDNITIVCVQVKKITSFLGFKI